MVLQTLRKNLSNIAGWRTKRKIVVFESDDWGSVRTRSKADYESMLAKGLNVDRSHFTRYDSLESNSDLENLFEVLNKHKDSTGRPAVFTPMCLVANPDFEKIRNSGFEAYFYEPFTETSKKYPQHDKVPSLWLEGVKNRLFVPQLHGREHLNVHKWMLALRENNEGLRIAFDHESFGVSYYKTNPLPEYLAAFDPDTPEEIYAYNQVITTAAELFNNICGYKPACFIASNSPEPKSLEPVLYESGVEYLTRYKIQRYPMGNGKFHYELNWLGKKNKNGQTIITRNCGFEPSGEKANDSVDLCLNEIKNAFYWGKPAVISSHRVNYVSYIEPKNGESGLNKLDALLTAMVAQWPDIEFLTSVELGKLINSSCC